MSRRLYPHNRVRKTQSFEIDEICQLFAEHGLHPQTVREWIKNGLPTVDKGKPFLIYGNHLIEFLKKHNAKNKCKTLFHKIFCMKCKDARDVFQKKVALQQKPNGWHVQGVCLMCKGRMFQTYKVEDYTTLKRVFDVVGVLELYDPEYSTDSTHIDQPSQSPLCEFPLLAGIDYEA